MQGLLVVYREAEKVVSRVKSLQVHGPRRLFVSTVFRMSSIG